MQPFVGCYEISCFDQENKLDNRKGTLQRISKKTFCRRKFEPQNLWLIPSPSNPHPINGSAPNTGHIYLEKLVGRAI